MFGNFLIRIESASHFSDFSNFLEGRLPPEDGSDWAENLTRFVSDKRAKKVFLARTCFSGCQFSDFSDFLGGRLPPEDGSDWAENLTRFVSDEIAKNIFLAQTKNLGVNFRAFCSSTVLTFGLFAVRPF